MLALICGVFIWLRSFIRFRHDLGLEIAALRQQLTVLKRRTKRPRLRGFDRLFWVLLRRVNIGRITTSGALTEYQIPTASSKPQGITAGPDGALWFTENAANKIGRISTAGTFNEYPTPTASSNPFGITAGQDGVLWFTEESGNRIGRISTAGLIDDYPVPTASSEPAGIVEGLGGILWFSEQTGNNIGFAIMLIARPLVEPASGSGLSQVLTVRVTDATALVRLRTASAGSMDPALRQQAAATS